VIELVEITEACWRDALEVRVRPDQLAFVAEHEPLALVILAKCHLRPDGRRWVPYLATADERPVGVFALAFGAQDAHLRHFAVDHRVQRRGIGREMLAAALERAAVDEPECRRVLLTTHPENEAALALYRAGGFVDTGLTVGIEPLLARDLFLRS
jgi:ribosomal protein S18 acetylase RimI-like enzyme